MSRPFSRKPAAYLSNPGSHAASTVPEDSRSAPPRPAGPWSALEASEAARVLLGALAATPLSPLTSWRSWSATTVASAGPTSPAGLLTLRSWETDRSRPCLVPFVALDLETTGAKAGAGKITEVGAVRIEGLQVVGEFQTLVNPQRPIPADDHPHHRHHSKHGGRRPSHRGSHPVTPRVHRRGSGRSPQRAVRRRLPQLRASSAPRAADWVKAPSTPCRSLARLLPGLANYRLGTVAQALEAPVTACHRALADAQAVAHVFVRLAEVLQSRGATSLSEMRAQGRGSPPSHLSKLALTRDLPEGPGAYVFVGDEDRPLMIGRADNLARGRPVAVRGRSSPSSGLQDRRRVGRAHRLRARRPHPSKPLSGSSNSSSSIARRTTRSGWLRRATCTSERPVGSRVSVWRPHAVLLGIYRTRAVRLGLSAANS